MIERMEAVGLARKKIMKQNYLFYFGGDKLYLNHI